MSLLRKIIEQGILGLDEQQDDVSEIIESLRAANVRWQQIVYQRTLLGLDCSQIEANINVNNAQIAKLLRGGQ